MKNQISALRDPLLSLDDIKKKKKTHQLVSCGRLMAKIFTFNFTIPFVGEGNGNPLQYTCLEKPMDGGAWWAAVQGLLRVGHD